MTSRVAAPLSRTFLFRTFLFRTFLMLMVCAVSTTASRAQFNLSVNSPLTIQTEKYAPVTVTMTSANDSWSGAVTLTCSTTAPYVSCIWPNAQQTFAVSAGSPATATIYINTSEVFKYESKVQPSRMQGVALCSLFAPAMCWLFLGGRSRKKAFGLMLFGLALLPLGALTGCGSRITPPSTPPGTYSVIFNGYSGYYAPTAVLQLIVTP